MATKEDYEIRRTIWDSRIPVEFTMDNSQPGIMRTNQPSYMLLSRISYFSLCLDQPLRILMGNNIEEKNLANVWLLHNGEILRWHYPIGVLYDMYTTELKERKLPWLITIKQKDFPDQLVRCFSKDVMKFNFLQSLKEASQMKHKRNIASTMTKEEHDRLFDSIYNDRFNDFWSINEKLMKIEAAERDDNVLNLPIRFYQRSFPFRQIHIPLRLPKQNDQFVNTTLNDALVEAFPEFGEITSKIVAISHGIELPMDTTAGWMAKNLSYPDNFVHVVVFLRQK